MLLFALLACETDSLSQAWQIDRLRVLAVKAEPAEPRPGDLVTFDALVLSPEVALGGSVWFVCSGGVSSEFGCDIDPGLLDSVGAGTAEAEDLADAGFVGFLPDVPPMWFVPLDYLDGLTEAEQLEGTFAMTYVTAFPELVAGEPIDEDEVEVAYKRVPVSLAPTPNHNPVVTGWRIDGVDIAPEAVVHLDPGQAYTMELVLAEDAVEPYTFRTSAGIDESREEEPYFSWYLQEGEFSQSSTLWPYASTVWLAPDEPTLSEQTVWGVVRDRRGGMGWASLSVSFGSGD